MRKWIQHIENHRLPIFFEINKRFSFSGVGLELGAGSCWLSSLISRQKNVQKIISLDINSKKIELAKKYFVPYFKGDYSKIDFQIADFNKFEFPRNYFDFIICDASLHHSEDIKQLLNLVRFSLKQGGKLIAMREPILPALPLLRQWKKRIFGRKERKNGDIENIYSRKEWKEFFSESGFLVDFCPCFPDSTPREKIVKKLAKFNGIIFNRYYIIAQ
jgi:ubiquinone/menaquinone biosynthesis C-methylase UbiE